MPENHTISNQRVLNWTELNCLVPNQITQI